MNRRLAMTAGRRQAFARQAIKRFDTHQAQLQPAVRAAIDAYLQTLRSRTASSLTAASPQPAQPTPPPVTRFRSVDAERLMKLLDNAAAWPPLLDAKVMPVYAQILDSILGKGLSDSRISVDLIKWRNQWLADRRQLLVGVPDQITSQFRTELQNLASVNGTSVQDAMQAAEKMLSDGYPSWASRAETIARTEVVGANNQGSLATWGAVAEASGATATKSWLATEDNVTREDHADADGQEVGINEMFDVGGEAMNGPGDPDADAGQVINCRCTLTYAFADNGEAASSADGGDAAVEQAPEDGGEGDGSSPLGDAMSGLTAAASSPPSGVAIMLGLDITSEQECAAQGVEVDPPGLHCTVAYLSEPAASYSAAQKSTLISTLAGLTPELQADAFATAHFNPDDEEREPCAVLLVQSDALNEIHEQVAQAISQAGLEVSAAFPIWIPHVAIAYNADPSVIPPGAVGSQIGFNRLVIGWAGEQIVVAGEGASDPSGEDGAEPDLTAATEAAVTAPAEAPPAAPAPATAGADGGDTAAPEADLTPQGITWSGPIAMLDMPSGDGRAIAAAGITIRPLPLPLSWQRESGMDHDDSVVVGRILAAEVRGNVLWGSGDFLDPMVNYDVTQCMAQIDAGLGLVSVDLAISEMGWADQAGNPIDPVLWDGDEMDIVTVALASSLGGATVVSFPAFEQARIALDPSDDPDALGVSIGAVGMPYPDGTFAGGTPEQPTISADGSSVTLQDGSTVSVGDDIAYNGPDGTTLLGVITAINSETSEVTITPAPADDGTQPPDLTVGIAQLQPSTPTAPSKGDGEGGVMTASLTASSELRPYTATFFEREEPDFVQPFTIDTATGECYGHMATYNECHIGKLAETGACVVAPKSQIDYSDFHLSPVLTDKGPLDIGKITLGTGHAVPGAGFAGAVAHYDNTGTQVAVVRAKDGKHGIWLAGQLIHDTPPAKVEELMRSPLSGDWRARNGNLELVAALAVNTPGFPVRRPTPQVGFSEHGKLGQLSLVAAGMIERGTTTDMIGLPSGAQISRGDLESMTAAFVDALNKGKRVIPTTAGGDMALRAARARLALRQRSRASV